MLCAALSVAPPAPNTRMPGHQSLPGFNAVLNKGEPAAGTRQRRTTFVAFPMTIPERVNRMGWKMPGYVLLC